MTSDDSVKVALRNLCAGLPVDPLPPARRRDETIAHAPTRVPVLSAHQQKVTSFNHCTQHYDNDDYDIDRHSCMMPRVSIER